MRAGRPYNSKTPVWRNKTAIKVRMYHFLCFQEHKTPTKYGCAKYMNISRTTAIKWFDVMKWNNDRNTEYWAVRKWLLENYKVEGQHIPERCAEELGYNLTDVQLDMEMFKIEHNYVLF